MTPKEQRVQELEAALAAAGGRGVEIADELDALRLELRYAPCPDCRGESFDFDFGPDGEDGAFDIYCKTCPWTMFVPESTKARTRISAINEIVALHSAKRVEGYLVDAFTAGMLLSLYFALGKEAREKFGKPSLPQLVDFGWKHSKSR